MLFDLWESVLECIDKGQDRFGGSEVILVLDGLASAAFAAFELVVMETGISQSGRSLEVPMFAEHPLVTVRKSGSDEPAFVAVVLQVLENGVGDVDTAHIELTAMGMDADEMAVELLAEPIPVLGHEYPVAHLLDIAAASELPGVETVVKLCSAFLAQSNFEPEVGCGSGIVKQVCLHAESLGMKLRCHQGHQEDGEKTATSACQEAEAACTAEWQMVE